MLRPDQASLRRLVVIAVLGGAACDKAITPSAPSVTGELRLMLQRSLTSSVPSQADYAVVRVWHVVTASDQVKRVQLPAPGSASSVTFTVPARSGYSVGVIATYGYSIALAGGRVDNVTVGADSTTSVHVDVVPWVLKVSMPDTLVSGDAVTTAGAAVVQGSLSSFIARAGSST